MLFFLLLTVSLHAKRDNPESWYVDLVQMSLGGDQNVRMSNGTYCDLLTADCAWEVDFADKWAESIGQSLNYSTQSGRPAGIILIMESDKDQRFVDRLKSVIESHRLPITLRVWRSGESRD
ncbi:hypothetical protein [Cerasicoccus frondis]|uniref:hypothetical protein n=1 Tax=Cerasicoccus frondis TaxID=490090 RepID=UPI002852CE0B|nr:hypothetical protein [Cerasicoccus frondis]